MSERPAIEVRAITADETLPLRHAVLRPASPTDDLRFEGDVHEQALHVGAFVDGRLAGVATVSPEPPPWEPTRTAAWRLRGMATAPELRRQGLGRSLLTSCERHILDAGGRMLWFNARTPALPFYRALGYELRGEEFDIPGAGPHFQMWKELAPPHDAPTAAPGPGSR